MHFLGGTSFYRGLESDPAFTTFTSISNSLVDEAKETDLAEHFGERAFRGSDEVPRRQGTVDDGCGDVAL